MSFTSVVGLILLGILAIAILGPSKLPQGVEQLWLMLTNFRRSQQEQPLLTLEQARRSWEASENPLYDLVQILYGSVEHLVELRHRIFYVVGTMIIAGIAAAIFLGPLRNLLVAPKGNVELIFTSPPDMVAVNIEIVLSVAAVAALPVVVYQILMFIRPALETQQELTAFKTVAWLGIPAVLALFCIGVAFAYFIMLPFALQYLADLGGDIAKAQWTIRNYYSFVLSVLLWIGLAFETPLVMMALSWLGLVSPKSMMKQWRYAIVGVAVLAAIITPTVDPVNMMLVMGPLLLLYFMGVLFSRAVYRPRRTSTADSQLPSDG
jgi:sec-independent protein translocase protein TatC